MPGGLTGALVSCCGGSGSGGPPTRMAPCLGAPERRCCFSTHAPALACRPGRLPPLAPPALTCPSPFTHARTSFCLLPFAATPRPPLTLAPLQRSVFAVEFPDVSPAYDVEALDSPAHHPTFVSYQQRQRAGPQPCSLDKCMETFLQPERLSESDAWWGVGGCGCGVWGGCARWLRWEGGTKVDSCAGREGRR